MRFVETNIPSAYIVEIDRHEDERGFFARTWDQEEFAARGLSAELLYTAISYNPHRGTLRGLHYQTVPFAETKLVRCTVGAIYDVVVDLRPQSPAYGVHVGIELSAHNRSALFVPEGCAHGFLTLADGSEVLYQMTGRYHHAAAAGIRWNDPVLGITWPEPVRVISGRDASYPDLAL